MGDFGRLYQVCLLMIPLLHFAVLLQHRHHYHHRVNVYGQHVFEPKKKKKKKNIIIIVIITPTTIIIRKICLQKL